MLRRGGGGRDENESLGLVLLTDLKRFNGA